DYSRARLTRWIKEGHVQVDGRHLRPRDAVHGGEEVVLEAEQEVETTWRAQDIPLDIVFEDEAVLVINKPAGLVVHPGAGNMDGTLSNALLHYDPALEQVPRAGVVHRLDKDTSGLLVVARTLMARKSLVEQLQARDFEREYLALAVGLMTAGGTVEAPIGRHPTHRLRQAVVPGGREAITHYRVEERFRAHTLLRVKLETGRTHQIRVHMAYLKYPLVGDPVYGGRLRIPAGATPGLDAALRVFKRQALHAERLGFEHPISGESVSWQVPLPVDMAALVDACREDSESV
ncbi:MAG TPA: 23S rRNA pseudouridine(1911/1915/1917) synthase RluD, partial [Chromatiales bacterium]|nr:23S rRNA pseudouridine(1911/1915/1917) synthase RluD [Chromatiales bacterium]HEX21915.1 23S rRNA pseudouridine(1911/1915/1917) synthase RluD [Chromatiales bacterium]